MFAPKTDSIRLFVGGGVRRGGKGRCFVWTTDKNFSIFRIGRGRLFGCLAALFGGFILPCIGVAVFRAVLSFFARSARSCPFWSRDLRAVLRIYFFHGWFYPVRFDVAGYLQRGRGRFLSAAVPSRRLFSFFLFFRSLFYTIYRISGFSVLVFFDKKAEFL